MRTAIASLFLLAVLLAPVRAMARERPNILFIFSDDHSPNAIGAYRGWLAGVDPTPNIRAIASNHAAIPVRMA